MISKNRKIRSAKIFRRLSLPGCGWVVRARLGPPQVQPPPTRHHGTPTSCVGLGPTWDLTSPPSGACFALCPWATCLLENHRGGCHLSQPEVTCIFLVVVNLITMGVPGVPAMFTDKFCGCIDLDVGVRILSIVYAVFWVSCHLIIYLVFYFSTPHLFLDVCFSIPTITMPTHRCFMPQWSWLQTGLTWICCTSFCLMKSPTMSLLDGEIFWNHPSRSVKESVLWKMEDFQSFEQWNQVFQKFCWHSLPTPINCRLDAKISPPPMRYKSKNHFPIFSTFPVENKIPYSSWIW